MAITFTKVIVVLLLAIVIVNALEIDVPLFSIGDLVKGSTQLIGLDYTYTKKVCNPGFYKDKSEKKSFMEQCGPMTKPMQIGEFVFSPSLSTNCEDGKQYCVETELGIMNQGDMKCAHTNSNGDCDLEVTFSGLTVMTGRPPNQISKYYKVGGEINNNKIDLSDTSRKLGMTFKQMEKAGIKVLGTQEAKIASGQTGIGTDQSARRQGNNAVLCSNGDDGQQLDGLIEIVPSFSGQDLMKITADTNHNGLIEETEPFSWYRPGIDKCIFCDEEFKLQSGKNIKQPVQIRYESLAATTFSDSEKYNQVTEDERIFNEDIQKNINEGLSYADAVKKTRSNFAALEQNRAQWLRQGVSVTGSFLVKDNGDGTATTENGEKLTNIPPLPNQIEIISTEPNSVMLSSESESENFVNIKNLQAERADLLTNQKAFQPTFFNDELARIDSDISKELAKSGSSLVLEAQTAQLQSTTSTSPDMVVTLGKSAKIYPDGTIRSDKGDITITRIAEGAAGALAISTLAYNKREFLKTASGNVAQRWNDFSDVLDNKISTRPDIDVPTSSQKVLNEIKEIDETMKGTVFELKNTPPPQPIELKLVQPTSKEIESYKNSPSLFSKSKTAIESNVVAKKFTNVESFKHISNPSGIREIGYVPRSQSLTTKIINFFKTTAPKSPKLIRAETPIDIVEVAPNVQCAAIGFGKASIPLKIGNIGIGCGGEATIPHSILNTEFSVVSSTSGANAPKCVGGQAADLKVSTTNIGKKEAIMWWQASFKWRFTNLDWFDSDAPPLQFVKFIQPAYSPYIIKNELFNNIPAIIEEDLESRTLRLSASEGDSSSGINLPPSGIRQPPQILKEGTFIYAIPLETNQMSNFRCTMRPSIIIYNGEDPAKNPIRLQLKDDKTVSCDYEVVPDAEIKLRDDFDCTDKACGAGNICEQHIYKNKLYNACIPQKKEVNTQSVLTFAIENPNDVTDDYWEIVDTSRALEPSVEIIPDLDNAITTSTGITTEDAEINASSGFTINQIAAVALIIIILYLIFEVGPKRGLFKRL